MLEEDETKVEHSEEIINYSGRLIAKNTFYNLLGYGIPIVFAIVIIPYLIKGLGEERFGILSLAWIVIGYFGLFDFGIGRTLTKVIAEKIGTAFAKEIPAIFWTSFVLMVIISMIISVILLLFASSIVFDTLKISQNLQDESLETFYILAFAIPIITTTAGIRGVLEAYQKFVIINVIRVALGVLSFLVPLLCLYFTQSLFWIVFFLVIVRIIIWFLYIYECFKLNSKIKSSFSFKIYLIKPILKISGWMTVTNILVPVMVYLDRFLIGAFISAAAIAYYTTPYEAVTKILLIPGALIGVLFPAFSANYLSNPGFTKKISVKAVKYIFLLLFPLVLLVINFAYEGMNLWLGKKFAEESSLILQFLAAGVLFNSIAYIPGTLLQGMGRPDITAKINLVELPFYILAMWFAIKYAGIKGAAVIWFLRMLIDTIALFLFSKKLADLNFVFKPVHIIIILLIVFALLPLMINDVYIRLLIILMILFAFSFISWKFLLLKEEKNFLTSRLKILNL